MKAIKIITILLLVICCFILIACDNEFIEKGKEDICEVLELVEQGHFDLAQRYVHPDKSINIEGFFNSLEQTENVDFQSGIEIDKIKNYSYSSWNSDVDGKEYRIKMHVNVNEKDIYFTISVGENDNGYGIWHLAAQ